MKIKAINYPREACQSAFIAAARDLKRFRPANFYSEAADKIAQAQGFPASADLKESHSARLSIIRELLSQEPPEIANQLTIAQIQMYLASPSNYNIFPQTYISLEMARRVIFQKSKPSGVQLASNWGLYPLFLKERHDFPCFWGLDIDPFAVAFAREIGAPVILGDAKKLPFASGSLDLVVSCHFLDFAYIKMIDLIRQLNGEKVAVDYRTAVMREVVRVLKPGGWFISQTEAISEADIKHSWPDTIANLATFNFEDMSFDNLYALQKI